MKLNLSAHVKSQVLRFVRLFAASFFATGVLSGASYGKDAIIAAVIGALETAWRQVNQVVPAAPPADKPAS